MENGVEGKMVPQEAIEVEEAPDERMNWKPQTTNEKRNEAYPFLLDGMGDDILHYDIVDVGEHRAKAVSGGSRYPAVESRSS